MPRGYFSEWVILMQVIYWNWRDKSSVKDPDPAAGSEKPFYGLCQSRSEEPSPQTNISHEHFEEIKHTILKTNITEPKNGGLEDDIHFQVPC